MKQKQHFHKGEPGGNLKTNHKKKALTFGELILAVYNACGKRKARAMVRLAVNAHVVEFRGHQHGVIS